MDLALLGSKLRRYREQFQATPADLQDATGISESRLAAFEDGQAMPTGDEILILADYYKCDYKFFVSNEKLAPFEQTDMNRARKTGPSAKTTLSPGRIRWSF